MPLLSRAFFIKNLNWSLIGAVLLLQCIGVLNIYSATAQGSADTLPPFVYKQLIWLGLGWGVFFFLSFTGHRWVQKFWYVFYIFNILALMWVLIGGQVFNGARRWIDLGFMRYQPSETVKLVVILMLAHFCSLVQVFEKMGFVRLALPATLTLIVGGLVLKQPDLGTAALIAILAVSCVFTVGITRRVAWAFGLSLLIGLPLMWSWGLKDYQKRRVTSFVSASDDPLGAAYNSIQSKVSVGSGQFWGKGFRQGTQTQLEFLPERHTDFIFSVISEEHGLVGSLSTLALFGLLFFAILTTAAASHSRREFYVVVGCLFFIFWHMFINICMVTGLMPIVGVPLPLVSYGGSHMLTTMCALGLVSSIHYRNSFFGN